MKKMNGAAMALNVVLLLLTFTGCSKSKDEDEDQNNTGCKTCKAYNPNGSVAGQEEVCGESQQSAFYNKYPGKEISCH